MIGHPREGWEERWKQDCGWEHVLEEKDSFKTFFNLRTMQTEALILDAIYPKSIA